MNKELVEKMKVVLKKYPNLSAQNEVKIAEQCAAVASEHYGDKWVKPEDGMPEDVSKVYFYTKYLEIVYEGRFFENSNPHPDNTFLNDRGVRYSKDEIEGWMYKKLPQPPQK